MDLQETIKLCQLGDKEAFKALFSSIENKALSTAYLISGNRGIAEDILQESYIKCFKEIKKLKEPEAFNTWFYRILVRTGWNMTKKQSSITPMDPWDISKGFNYDADQDVDHIIGAEEVKDTVKRAIDSLSGKLKSTVILYYFNDMTIDEISKIEGCLKATVKSRLFYARNKLKKELGYYFESEFSLGVTNRRECKSN